MSPERQSREILTALVDLCWRNGLGLAQTWEWIVTAHDPSITFDAVWEALVDWKTHLAHLRRNGVFL